MANIMYNMKPVYQAVDVNELPTCMYKMKNYHSDLGDFNGSKDDKSEVQALFARQDAIIAKLEALKAKIDGMSSQSETSSSTNSALRSSIPQGSGSKTAVKDLPKDIVICCNPGIEPSALLHLLRELRSAYKVLCTCYTHSSSKSSPCKDLTKCGFVPNLVGESRAENDIVITWIWKDCRDCEMMVSPIKQTKITGEVNICRYLMRILGAYPADPVQATIVDNYLDMATALLGGDDSEKPKVLAKMVKHLEKNPFMSGSKPGLVDAVLCSAYDNAVLSGWYKWANEANLKKWCSTVKKTLS